MYAKQATSSQPRRPRNNRLISSVDPPNPDLLAIQLARLERRIDRLLASVERDLVTGVAEVLDLGVAPFGLIERVHLGLRRGTARIVVANAIVAASHTVLLLDRRDQRQVEFLVTACPVVSAGAGWLRRLHRACGRDPCVLSAAFDAIATCELDRWEEVAA